MVNAAVMFNGRASGGGDGREGDEAHPAGPLLSHRRLVTVDGHPVCASCGLAVTPRGAGRWEHVPEGSPFPRRSRWFAQVAWAELRGMRSYRDFTQRYPWTVRPELCGGAITTEEDWADGTRRLRDYHGQLAAARRRRVLRPGDNPYLELVQVLGGGRGPAGPGGWAVSGGLAHVLDLPARRRELAAIFAWAIPGSAALSLLGRYGPLLECGAGTGYWAALLAAAGTDVVASDILTDDHRPWVPVLPSDSAAAVRSNADRVLFLCWPPYDDDAASYAALRAYQGDTLLYIGELRGRNSSPGATGTVRFHRELTLNWSVAEQVALPTWPGLRDRLVVYRRNPSRRPLAERDRCPECHRFLPTGAVGRCDRCFSLRPPAMAVQMDGHRVEYPSEVVAAMPEGLRRAFERSPSLLWPPASVR
jgi:hypothetical protein